MIAGDSIGVIQGWFLSKVGGRIRAFPGVAWEYEFDLAAELGFGSADLNADRLRHFQTAVAGKHF